MGERVAGTTHLEALKALHAKAPLRRSRGHLHAKIRILRPGVFLVFAWASGTRHWTALELQKLKALQVRMTRRAGHVPPHPGEE